MTHPPIVACVHSYLNPVLASLNEIGKHPVEPNATKEEPSLLDAMRAIGVEEHLLNTSPTDKCLSHKSAAATSAARRLISVYRDAAADSLTVAVEGHDGGATTLRRAEVGDTIAVTIFVDRKVYPRP